MNTKRKISKLVLWIFIFATFSIVLLSIFNSRATLSMIATIFLLIELIIYCFTDLKQLIVHLIFYISIFVFLLSRPLIDYCRNHTLNTYPSNIYISSFLIIALSLIALFMGGEIGIYYTRKNNKKNYLIEQNYNLELQFKQKYLDKYQSIISKVALFMFSVSYPFYVLRILEKVIFKQNTDYYYYYANFTSKLPYFTYIISTFMFYSICVYLATKPSKKRAYVVLGLYVLAEGLYLLIGTRNPFVLSLMFSFLYFFIRNQEKGEWIGKFEKILIFVAIPLVIVMMALLNYFRDGKGATFDSIGSLFVDFFYKQGTSFGVLAKGYLFNKNISFLDLKNFTFGPVIDYFKNGSLAKILLGKSVLSQTTNSIEMGLYSNSYAHNLSYVVMGDEYLKGHGLGSSYIMELYTDYSYLGVLIGSLFLGFVFIFLINGFYKNKLIRSILASVVFSQLFFTPRSSFLSAFFPLATMQFWFFMGMILLVTTIILNKYLLRRNFMKFQSLLSREIMTYMRTRKNRFLITMVILFVLMIIPLYVRDTQKKAPTVKTNYSAYIVYDIKSDTIASQNDLIIINEETGYSDFYYRLLTENTTGIFLFDEIDNDELQKYADDMNTTISTLRNSLTDYWSKNIRINKLSNDLGIAVTIITPNQKLNEIIENKYDLLMDQYKSNYEGVNISKTKTLASKGIYPIEENIEENISIKNMVAKIVIVAIIAFFITIGIFSLIFYINPTINSDKEFLSWRVKRIFNPHTIIDLEASMDQIIEKNIDITYCALDEVSFKNAKKIFNSKGGFKQNIIISGDLCSIHTSENLVIICEYGQTKLIDLYDLMNNAVSFDKKIVAAINLSNI